MPDGERGVVVITGASRGIGAAAAILAAQAGFDVVVNYRQDKVGAGNVVERIEAAGGRAMAVQADTGQDADIVRMFEVAAAFGPLTGLVNNAGMTGRRCLIEEVDAATLEHVFRVNISGYFLCAREAVKYMSTKHGGRGGAIVNVSSIAAKLSNAFDWVHYGASKGAIDTFTKGMALEGAEHGIRCNGVRPGMTVTDLNPMDRIEKAAPTIPLKRAAEPREIAEGIVWLLSDKAAYCTATIIDVTGGRG
ncbi:MAG: NAD(P)-dependent oxidoreductase [Gammaproteobacteria bacterium]|nr:NAD(P)-dependent oxidoreductase [Gammaproteobacteria bacterium]